MTLNRREFLRSQALGGIALGFAPSLLSQNVLSQPVDPSQVSTASLPSGLPWFSPGKARLGIIGLGGRGSWTMNLALKREATEVVAICDIQEEATERALGMAADAGKIKPEVYNSGDYAFLELVQQENVDGVIIATPWEWHTPMALAAMKAGKYAGVEVPAALTVDDCFELVSVSEETGMPCMMLENVCYRRDVMAVLNMVRQDMFGELVHCHCGYQHDLRGVKFNPGVQFGEGARGEAVWRTEHSIHRNGDLYPTHGLGPVANFLNINRGNRFLTLTSLA